MGVSVGLAQEKWITQSDIPWDIGDNLDGHIKIEKCCIVVSPLDVDQHRCALSSRALNEVFKNKVFEI